MELLERAFLCLEKGDWDGADQCCSKVLEQNPENGQAYLGKLMAELHVRTVDGLKDCSQRFDNRMSYRRGLPYFDEALQAKLDECIAHINRRNEQTRLEQAYRLAGRAMDTASTEAEFLEAAQLFSMIRQYENAEELEKVCRDRAEAARKDAIVQEASAHMDKELPGDYEIALQLLETVAGWKHADEKARICRKRIRQFRVIEEAEQIKSERRELWLEKGVKKTVSIAAIVLGAAAVLAFLLTRWVLPEIRYNHAVKQLSAGNAMDAYEILAALDGYKDSAQRADTIAVQYKVQTAREAAVGDYIPFGTYRQFSADADRDEDIMWRVLAVEDDRVLLISLYALDCKLYHEVNDAATWTDCSLRQWLNGAFLDAAFDAGEQERIAKVTHDGAEDRIFLLSAEEAQQYFESNEDRLCEATNYAQQQGAWVRGNRYSWWWLRSPGRKQGFAARVGTDGSINTNGNPFTYDYLVVRPAMWIDLSQ